MKSIKNNWVLILVLVGLLVLASIVLVNFLSFSNIQSIYIDQLRESQLSKVRRSADLIETHLFEVRDELLSLSKLNLIPGLNQDKCTDIKTVHKKLGSKLDSVLRVDIFGDVTECSSPLYSNYFGLNVKNKEYYAMPKISQQTFTSVLRQGESRQIVVSAPILSNILENSQFQGILFTIIEVNNLFNLYIRNELESFNYFILENLDANETILKSDYLINFNLDHDLYDTILVVKNKKAIITSANMVIAGDRWKLTIISPLDELGKEINSVKNRILITLGLISFIMVIVFIFLISVYRSGVKVQSQLDQAKIKLENLGININTEKGVYNQADIDLEPHKIYLIKKDNENNAHELFISTLNRGFAGLGIVKFPDLIKAKYNLQNTSFIHLEKIQPGSEFDINQITLIIKEFAQKSTRSVILIDSLNYLITENSFDMVIKMLEELVTITAKYESILILSLYPNLLTREKLMVIEKIAIDLYGNELKIDLHEMELDILNFVNQNNISNKLVSYKNITDKFEITKPTTRVKISRLHKLGFLQIEQKGRFKTLKITSRGRRVIG